MKHHDSRESRLKPRGWRDGGRLNCRYKEWSMKEAGNLSSSYIVVTSGLLSTYNSNLQLNNQVNHHRTPHTLAPLQGRCCVWGVPVPSWILFSGKFLTRFPQSPQSKLDQHAWLQNLDDMVILHGGLMHGGTHRRCVVLSFAFATWCMYDYGT